MHIYLNINHYDYNEIKKNKGTEYMYSFNNIIYLTLNNIIALNIE